MYFWIGTTGLFPYIQRPILDTQSPDRYAIEINPDETGLSDSVDIKIPLGAADALGRIWVEYRTS